MHGLAGARGGVNIFFEFKHLKWSQMAPKGLKWSQIVPNRLKWPQMSKMVLNGPKWCLMVPKALLSLGYADQYRSQDYVIALLGKVYMGDWYNLNQ